MYTSFYKNFVSLCTSIGKTPGEIAKELGFSNSTATTWKTRNAIPRQASLELIAKYFDVTPEDLQSESLIIDNKNPATKIGDGDKRVSIVNDRHAYINALFDQLTFENQVRAANELQSLLQRQQAQGGLKESD